jgi:excisionase family DNA binding protein
MSENELTTTEVINMLKCSRSTVMLLVERGHFPGTRKMDPTRKNSPLRIPRQEVEKFLESQIIIQKENLSIG